MDVASIAASAAAAQRAQTAVQIATEMAKQAHQQDQVMVGLLEQAAEAAKQANAEVAGTGVHVDIRV